MAPVIPYVTTLDPRLKLGVALVLGPCLWKVPVVAVAMTCIMLVILLIPLAKSQPLGLGMIRHLVGFVVFWVVLKAGLEVFSGLPLEKVLIMSGVLGLRLTSLLLLGLTLALSTSARSLGLAVSWAIGPVVGRERAWRMALSLALMIHFLPMCLLTMTSVKETVAYRYPNCGFWRKMLILPQAVIRNLGQKTWTQTLAVAGRGLEGAEAWQPDFSWGARDWLWGGVSALLIALMFAF